MKNENELKCLELIDKALTDDTILNCESIIIKRVYDLIELGNKKFWAFSYDNENEIEFKIKDCIKNIKRNINWFFIGLQRENLLNTLEFKYTLEKCETLRDYETNRKLIRGIIYFEFNELK